MQFSTTRDSPELNWMVNTLVRNCCTSSMLQVANTKPTPLAPRFRANAFPTAYVLHFANLAKNFTPYVTLASRGTNGAGYFWYMVKGKPTKLRGYSSVALSSLPGGSLNATSTGLGIGPLYISDRPLMEGVSPHCSPWKPAPAPPPLPSEPKRFKK